jgi:hypothetical protein
MKFLICGGRDWNDLGKVRARMERLPKDSVVIHGDARGADRMAGSVGRSLGLLVEAFPADWTRHGKAAGPIRNRQMLDQKPDLVIAFHEDLASSKGTLDCVSEARRRGIPVEVVS